MQRATAACRRKARVVRRVCLMADLALVLRRTTFAFATVTYPPVNQVAVEGRCGCSNTRADRLLSTFDIPAEDRLLHVRLDSAKVNIVRRGGKATWFKLVGVPIDNGTEEYPSGDEVQTVIPWTPPETWSNLSSVSLNAALTEIDEGLPNGQRYSGAPNAKERAAWPVVQKHCSGKSEAQCREMIRTWIKTGLLYSKDYNDPIDRKDRAGLYVDSSKRPS